MVLALRFVIATCYIKNNEIYKLLTSIMTSFYTTLDMVTLGVSS